MLRSYLLIAWRNFMRHKAFSLINVVGLSIGMAACMLIIQYVTFEFSYDRFHERADRIYRVINDRYQEGKLIQHGTITYPAIGPAMKKDFPEVEKYTRVTPGSRRLPVKVENRLFMESRSLWADANFLAVFSFPLLAGDVHTALKEPYQIVLSESLAKKYFPQQASQSYEQVLGKLVYLDQDKSPYQVSGVVQDVPENSFLQFDLITSYQTLIQSWGEGADMNWKNSDFYHFLLLKPGTDYKKLQAKFPAFSNQHFKGATVSGSEEKFYLQPFGQAHLFSDLEYEIGITGNGRAVWALLIIAIFILCIAWINYINLATTRAIERAKEVGVRKVIGATQSQLIRQFLSESVLLNLIALVIAITLVQIAQPWFNQVVEKNLSSGLLIGNGYGGGWISLFLLGLLAIGVFLSGYYPAFLLSAYKPVQVLKGSFQRSAKGVWLRKSLVIFQYTASIALIIGTLTVYHQIRYMTQKDLGMQIDQTLVVYGPSLTEWDSTYIPKVNSLKEELKKLASVKSAATSERLPGDRLGRMFDLQLVGGNANQLLSSSNLFVDLDFIETYQIQMLAGRQIQQTDHNPDWQKITNVVINQKAAELLGFSDVKQAVNRKVKFWGKTWEIIGVMDNFHQQSLKSLLEPIIFIPAYGNTNYFSFKVSTENVSQTIASIREKYLQFFPGNTFEHFFLDERFNQQYKDDKSFGRLLFAFAGLAIFIACLGLLGLSSYSTLQRTKEIGIRKVLGASVPGILFLLSKDFIRLILLANILAWPVAYWGIRKWLQNYAYRIDLNLWVFMLAAGVVLLIALAAISFQTLKAAQSNPVKSLRSE